MATEANNSGDQQNNDKVIFTPEQQARVDEIVRDAMGRAGAQHRTEAEAANQRATQLQTELEQARQELARAKTPGEKKAAKEDVADLEAQIAEMRNVHATSQAEVERLRKIVADKEKEIEDTKNSALNIQKRVAIQAAAGKVGFVDVSEVTELTERQVMFDQQRGRFVVLNQDGQPRLNSAYEPMSLDEFYAEFASKKPHLVRGDVKPGTGSAPSQKAGLSKDGKYSVEQIFGPKADPALANTLAQENIAEYRRLKAIAREAKLIKF